ncbi:MAG: pyridoxamine 5'-phosphate oxidase family protein [Planctomycetes bacterium]|nr:pyridoxamine 5'-phosphate oxidase family protein [Planctomycetota bacterium]
MAGRYLDTYLTPSVQEAQRRTYGRSLPRTGAGASRDPLGPEEAAFVAARDSFYLATVSPDGWPYVQHRGGPAGFLRVLDAHTLGFADLRGNRQLITVGHLGADGRVALLLMDYPDRRRLKVAGHARVVAPTDEPTLAERLAPADLRGRAERLVVIDVLSFDWNCPAFITPRYTAAEVERLVAPLRARIAQLEAGRPGT